MAPRILGRWMPVRDGDEIKMGVVYSLSKPRKSSDCFPSVNRLPVEKVITREWKSWFLPFSLSEQICIQWKRSTLLLDLNRKTLIFRPLQRFNHAKATQWQSPWNGRWRERDGSWRRWRRLCCYSKTNRWCVQLFLPSLRNFCSHAQISRGDVN